MMADLGIGNEEDEAQGWCTCPFCYVDIELPVLCIHLQEEHCFNVKENAVCPICAANLGKDALGHFMVHHSHSVKINNLSQTYSSSNDDISTNINEELSSFLGKANDSPTLHTTMTSHYSGTQDLDEKVCDVREYEKKMQQVAFIQDLLISCMNKPSP